MGEIVFVLAYADNMVILGNNRNEVEQTTKKASKVLGQEVNQGKTKYKCISRKGNYASDEQVKSY